MDISRTVASKSLLARENFAAVLPRELAALAAKEHVHPLLSDSMADQPKSQKTTPKGINPKTSKPFKPIEIPPLKRGEFAQVPDLGTKVPIKDARDIYGENWADLS
jgi:hypothetical protein